MKFHQNKYFLGIMTGLLLALSFPPFPTYIIAFLAFVPLLHALDKQPKSKFLMLYLTFFVFHGGTSWWIGSFQTDTDPFLIYSGFATWLGHPLFFIVPIYIYQFIRKHFKSKLSLYSFPFIWTTFEWGHSLGELSYPWLTVGNTQIYNYYWIQFIDITGVWGASFVICLVNVIIYDLLTQHLKIDGGLGYKALLSKNKIKIISLISMLFLPMVYGLYQDNKYTYENLMHSHKALKIGVIQPAINPWEKWATGARGQIKEHIRLQDSLNNVEGTLDLSVWSETAIQSIGYDFNTNHNFSFLQDYVDSTNTSLLTGFVDVHFYDSEEEAPTISKVTDSEPIRYYDTFNSAIMLNPNNNFSEETGLYNKMRLTPFGERPPYVEFYPIINDLISWEVGISFWGIGTRQNNLTLIQRQDSIDIASIICIESIYPNFVRKFAKRGAKIFTVITNDAWYDYTYGPEQHYLIAAMRAIENRRYIARSANTGVSGFISATGQSIKRAERYKQTAIAMYLPLIDELTIYTRYGDWLAHICFALTLSLVVASYWRARAENIVKNG